MADYKAGMDMFHLKACISNLEEDFKDLSEDDKASHLDELLEAKNRIMAIIEDIEDYKVNYLILDDDYF